MADEASTLRGSLERQRATFAWKCADLTREELARRRAAGGDGVVSVVQRMRHWTGEMMSIKDIGPAPQSFDLENATIENTDYRAVAWSGKYLQLTLMSIPVGGDVGLEAHPETDQFLRLDAGRGRVQMGPEKDQLDFDREVEDGWAILVPAGTWHNVTNIGDEPMRLYTVYAPVHHAAGKVQPTAADAQRDEESGSDEPPSWSAQPPQHPSDEHA